MTGMRVECWMVRTSALLPRGMTRSMYRSCESSAATSARVSTVCTNACGSAVRASAAWIARASAAAVRADSLPPLRIAALPDPGVVKVRDGETRGRTGFEGKRGDVDDYFWARLEDDEQYADWT